MIMVVAMIEAIGMDEAVVIEAMDMVTITSTRSIITNIKNIIISAIMITDTVIDIIAAIVTVMTTSMIGTATAIMRSVIVTATDTNIDATIEIGIITQEIKEIVVEMRPKRPS